MYIYNMGKKILSYLSFKIKNFSTVVLYPAPFSLLSWDFFVLFSVFLFIVYYGWFLFNINFLLLLICIITYKVLIHISFKGYYYFSNLLSEFNNYRVQKTLTILFRLFNRFPRLFSFIINFIIIYNYLIDIFLFAQDKTINKRVIYLGALFWFFFFLFISPFHAVFILCYSIIIPEFWALTCLKFVLKYPNSIIPPKSIFFRSMFRRAIQLGGSDPHKAIILGIGGMIGFGIYNYQEFKQHEFSEIQQPVRHGISEENTNRRWATEKLDDQNLSESRKNYYRKISETGHFPPNSTK
jgi:hypothetical protein